MLIYLYNFIIFTASKRNHLTLKNTEPRKLMTKNYFQSFLSIKKTLTFTKTIINRFLP